MRPSSVEYLGYEQVLQQFGTDQQYGLHDKEALLRRKEYGSNILPGFPYIPLLRTLFSPFLPILTIGIVLLSISTKSLFLTYFSVAITLVHQIIYMFLRWEKVNSIVSHYIHTAQQLPPIQHCVRNGKMRDIAVSQLVPGDIVFLERGQKVGADMRILSTTHLVVDESLHFGQAHTRVQKVATPVEGKAKSSIASNIVFAGSTICEGSAKGIIWKTGQKRLVNANIEKDTTINASLLQCQLVNLQYFYILILILIFSILSLLFGSFQASWSGPASLFFFLILPSILPFLFIPYVSFGHYMDVLERKDRLFLPLIPYFFKPDVQHSKIWVQRESIELSKISTVKKKKDILKNFFELFFLSLPETPTLHARPELDDLKQFIETYTGSVSKRLASLQVNEAASTSYVDLEEKMFVSKRVYLDTQVQKELSLICMHPAQLLERSSFLWDSTAHDHKRRKSPQEVQKLMKELKSVEEDGALLYAVGIEERKKRKDTYTSTITYIGHIIIPLTFKKTSLSRIQEAKKDNMHLYIYTDRLLNTTLISKNLGMSTENITAYSGLFGKSKQYKQNLLDNDIHVFEAPTYDELLDLRNMCSTKKGDALMIAANNISALRMNGLVTDGPLISFKGLLKQLQYVCIFGKLLREEIRHYIHLSFILAVLTMVFLPAVVQQHYLFLMCIPILPILFTAVSIINHLTRYKNFSTITQTKYAQKYYSPHFFYAPMTIVRALGKYLIALVCTLPLFLILLAQSNTDITQVLEGIAYHMLTYEMGVMTVVLLFMTLYFKRSQQLLHLSTWWGIGLIVIVAALFVVFSPSILAILILQQEFLFYLVGILTLFGIFIALPTRKKEQMKV